MHLSFLSDSFLADSVEDNGRGRTDIAIARPASSFPVLARALVISAGISIPLIFAAGVEWKASAQVSQSTLTPPSAHINLAGPRAD